MKKLMLSLTILIPFLGLGQNYNPFLVQGIISPAPLMPAEAGGTGEAAWIVGNSGGTTLDLVANDEMLLTITFTGGVPNVADPNNPAQAVASITGSFAGYFNWVYVPANRTFIGTQNQAIPGFSLNPLDPVSAGTVMIPYKVAENSSSLVPENGFDVTITPPAYSNISNTPFDDYVSSYTWTAAATLHIKGNVLNDANGAMNELIDGAPTDGTPVSVPGNLYVSLVTASDAIISTVNVKDDGSYQFFPTTGGQYRLVLHNNISGSSIATNLPNWANTSEGLSNGGDGLANGSITLTFSNASINNANFGIEQLPETESVTVMLKGQNNILGSMPLNGSDPEDGSLAGSLSAGYNFLITSLPTNAGLYYNNVLITAAHVAAANGPARITNYDPAKLVLRFFNKPRIGAVATFKYASVDMAGLPDPSPANYTVNIVKTLPGELMVSSKDPKLIISEIEYDNSKAISKVYPNPVVDNINIVFSKAGKYHLVLSDASGRRLMYKQADVTAGNLKMTIARGALPAGIYLLQVLKAGKIEMETIKLQFSQR